MKYCDKCKVSVNSPVARCPLCFATLQSRGAETEPLSYPDLREPEKYNILLRILLFLSLSVSVVCLTVNLLTTPGTLWSLIVVGNILYLWVTIGTAMRRHTKLGFAILVQGICLAGLVILLDFFLQTEVNWAFNFALPCLFFSATLAITIIVIVKRMAIRDFILYFILTALMGFIPVGLYALGLVTVPWPSLVSAVYSLLALVSIFIFADNATKIELKKRFHI